MRIISGQQRGFTLVEVLVTLMVFAVGMLGVAGMQMTALTGLDAAQYRSVAALKAAEMAERVRANPLGLYDGTAGHDRSCRSTHYDDLHPTVDDCDANTLAEDDLADWNKELAARLPVGKGTVCLDSTPDDGTPGAPACDGVGKVYAVKIWWTEKPRSTAVPPFKRLAIAMVA